MPRRAAPHLSEAERHGEHAHPHDAVHHVHDQAPIGTRRCRRHSPRRRIPAAGEPGLWRSERPVPPVILSRPCPPWPHRARPDPAPATAALPASAAAAGSDVSARWSGDAPVALEASTRWCWRIKRGPHSWGHSRRAEHGRECTRTHIHADPCVERHGDGRAHAFTCVCAYMYMTTHLAAALPPQRGSPA